MGELPDLELLKNAKIQKARSIVDRGFQTHGNARRGSAQETARSDPHPFENPIF
jgi:hypothetical protein